MFLLRLPVYNLSIFFVSSERVIDTYVVLQLSIESQCYNEIPLQYYPSCFAVPEKFIDCIKPGISMQAIV
jgi:hypothetical protein